MAFIQLNRKFIKLKSKHSETEIDTDNWLTTSESKLTWEQLLSTPKRCTIVLGEARIGKTTEFQQQAEIINQDDKYAFFIRLEDLREFGLEDSMFPNDCEGFLQWKTTEKQGIFFLDSVDEARLIKPNALEKALRRFVKDLQGIPLE